MDRFKNRQEAGQRFLSRTMWSSWWMMDTFMGEELPETFRR